MPLLLLKKPELIKPQALIVPQRLRGNRSRVSRLPAPWVRRYERIAETAAGAVYASAGTAGLGNSTTPVTCTPTVPSCALGNLLILGVVASTSGGSVHVTNFTVPSGWTELGNAGLSIRFSSSIIWKISDGTEGGTTPTTGFSFSATHGWTLAQVYCFTGNFNGSPEASISLTGSSTSGTVPTPYTTANDNDLLCCFYGSGSSNSTYGLISGSGASWTNQKTDVDASNNLSCNLQTAPVATAGSVSGGSSTLTPTGQWQSIAFAIRPAPSSARPPLLQFDQAAINRGNYY